MDADELRQWRKRTGYSQGKLARLLEVDVMTVSRWERNVMRIPKFLKWALAYIELKGGEFQSIAEKTKMKGGNRNGRISGMPRLPQKAKHK